MVVVDGVVVVVVVVVGFVVVVVVVVEVVVGRVGIPVGTEDIQQEQLYTI